VRVRSKRKI